MVTDLEWEFPSIESWESNESFFGRAEFNDEIIKSSKIQDPRHGRWLTLNSCERRNLEILFNDIMGQEGDIVCIWSKETKKL